MMTNNYNHVHILAFDDYCLERICNFLTLPEQINFALSSQRFAATLSLFYRSKLKNFDLSILIDLSYCQMRSFLQIVKPQIKTLTADFRDINDRMQIEVSLLLEPFLTDVEKLIVDEDTTGTLTSLIKNMHFLKELEIISAHINDGFFKSLATLKNLKALHIYSGYLSDKMSLEISELTGLEKLTLKYNKYSSTQFKLICENLTKLTYLNTGGIGLIREADTEDYARIVEHLPQLRTLKICCSSGNYNCLAHLPNLKILNIRFLNLDFAQIEEFFRNLANHQAHQLEELGIYAHILNMESATSIAKLKKLKVLKCGFSEDVEITKKISNLKELEEVDFYPPFSDNRVLQLLNNCLKLKRVRLWCSFFEEINMSRIRAIVERQNEQARRTAGKLIKSQFIYQNTARYGIYDFCTSGAYKYLVLEF